MKLQVVNYSALGLPLGPYSHAVIHGHTLYTSGMTAFGSQFQDAGITEQTKEIFNQLDYIAKEQGSNLNRLIKVTLFVSDLSDMSRLRQTLTEIYGAHTPASSLVEVKALFSESLKIEIEAIIAL